jgi:hypothetical protein
VAKFCNDCGSALRDDALFCGRCGTDASSRLTELEQWSKLKRRWIMPTVGVLFVITLFMTIYRYFSLMDVHQNQSNQMTVASPEPVANATSNRFDVRAHCAANPNDWGPGEQNAESLPQEVRAANADFWRCANAKVLVCYGGASGRACSRQTVSEPDYVAELERFCQSSPGSAVPYSTSGAGKDWQCEGRIPVMVGSTPVDRDGFFREAWRPLD